MKSLVAVLVVGCLLVAIPSQAKPTRSESGDNCIEACGGWGDNYDSECGGRCVARMKSCLNCCHTKLPGATKEHCQVSCEKNLTTYRCPK